MKNINKKSFFLLLIFLVSFALSANPLQPWDHATNPALLSTGKRKYVELGTSAKVSASNSYFTLEQLFPADGVLLLDFNTIAEDLDGKNLDVALNIEMEQHFVLTVMGVSLGQYATVDGAVSTGVPYNVIEVVADGISIGEANEGTGDVYAKVFATAGAYAGYRWRDWQFSAKMGAFAPLVYTDADAEFTYSAVNESDGTITAFANASIPLYSMFNISDPSDIDPAAIPESLGLHMDFGAVKVIDGKPAYGFSLTGLTLAKAALNYETTVSANASLTSDSLISYDEDAEEDLWTTTTNVDDVETVEGTYEVSMPLAVGGFYRLTGFPGFIDWIGTGELTLDDGDLLVGAGITAEGAIFPLNALSFTLEYDKFLWESSLGLRVNIRVIELGVDVGISSTRFVKMLTPTGVNAGFYMAMGF